MRRAVRHRALQRFTVIGFSRKELAAFLEAFEGLRLQTQDLRSVVEEVKKETSKLLEVKSRKRKVVDQCSPSL
jgi:hypothetical protein